MVESIQAFFQENFPPELAVFFIAMIPLIECRGAIPFGMLVLEMPLWEVLPIAILGNILPVPFILLLIRPVISWLKKTRLFRPLAHWIEGKAEKKKDRVLKYRDCFCLSPYLFQEPARGQALLLPPFLISGSEMRFLPFCLV